MRDTSAQRAQYLAERGFDSPIKLIYEFERRDTQLQMAPEFEEIVLWFEHDLYDQLQILQVLTALEEMNLEPGRVALIQSDHYLESMTVDELLPLLPKRRTATPAIFRSARRSWERFTSPSPQELYAAAGQDLIGFPFLRAAMARLCEEYPWTRDGLSRSQRQALYAVAHGSARIDELFARSQAREEASFLGSRAFAVLLDELRAGGLIEGNEPDLALTVRGRSVLAGDADWLQEHVIDRWVGGVHLMPGTCTRWDEDTATFV